MKKILIALALSLCLPAVAQSLVLLHTNDTHSNIDPDAHGVGGILPRKAIIDSVRKAEKNVILIDAGDMVQGTLYFKFFKGDVEYPLFNMMDYDVRILGNHEFDNGLGELASYWKKVKGARLSANYDFSDTPARGIFEPYVIKKVGNKKVGIMGINVDPASLISEENYEGMRFHDIIDTANATASLLKKKGCDLVVAVTHIGYDVPNGKTDDLDLARASKDIDIIIGGHSHTFVDPATPDKTPYWIKNAAGRDVLVTQTGKYGKNVGYIKLDLKDFSDRRMDYRYIPVTDRFAARSCSREMQDFLKDYPGDMILVTHSRDEAYKFCRELSIVHEGRILVTGETKQLFERPGLLEAAKLTGCKNFSRAERLGPHEIYAADWKMKLHTEENVDMDITHVGIRGHWIRPESEPGENCMAVQVDQYIETTFEHQYMIRNKAEENASGLWWMRPKNSFTEDPDKNLPEYLYLPPEHLMLLK